MDSALLDQTCDLYLGQWKQLVSTTNWDKGQIIHEWREALIDANAPAVEYSDEAWSRRVGNVTPQHVGRLRRAHERFGQTRDEYPGLFWSHFQAALDWDDAEMWLEGAVQNDWSISEMRHKRWETNGGVEAEPSEAEASADAPWDEDADSSGEVTGGSIGTVNAPERKVSESDDDDDADDFAERASDDDEAPYDDGTDATEHDAAPERASQPPTEVVRPFASLPPLPPDLSDAFESYKLCILRNKLAGWQDISRDDLIATLEALKQLALAPTEL
jgi:hypothetical protein